MTILGAYLNERLVNRADLSRQTGISPTRIFTLCQHESAQLRIEEFYKICLALKLDPNELLQLLCGHIKLPDNKK